MTRRTRRQSLTTILAVVVSATIAVTQMPAAPASATASATVPAGDTTASALLTGEDAVDALEAGLGGGVAAVARRHDLDPADLVDDLREDSRLVVDPRGNLIYAEPPLDLARLTADIGADAAAEADAAADHDHDHDATVRPATGTIGTATAVTPVNPSGFQGSTPSGLTRAQTFALASRPNARITIYLDFDGHVTTGTAWNRSPFPTTFTTVSPAKTPGVFTQTELDFIAKVWAEVAEDYAPFGINVTTIDPGSTKLARSSPTDQEYGVRVVFGRNSFYPNQVSGVALLGSIDDLVDTPVYVFYYEINYLPLAPVVAKVASHEAGHAFGLSHHGTSADEYYTGHGTWAPIMGAAAYASEVVQWSHGEYPGANRPGQDDIDIIDNWAPPAADPEGNTNVPYDGGRVPIRVKGVIGTRSDTDVFEVSTRSGLRITLTPTAGAVTNLDASVTVTTLTGRTLATLDPPGPGAIDMYVPVGAGDFLVHVDGVGRGNLTNGYSDYGSLGGYDITIAPGRAIAVTATWTRIPNGVRFTANAVDDGGPTTLTWTFSDGAPAMTGASVTRNTVGPITATVQGTNPLGMSGRAVLQVTAPNGAPVPVIAPATTTVNVNTPVALSATGSTDPNGDTMTYEWSMGDGIDVGQGTPIPSTTATGPTVTHTYTRPGTYRVTLHATDSLGARSVTYGTVTVRNPPHILRILFAGNGTGSIQFNPSGLGCPSSSPCEREVVQGSTSTMTAVPATGSTFTGWSGGCTGTAPCRLTFASDVTLTATFTKQRVPLTVTKSGTGSGTVTAAVGANPGGITCGIDCTETYDHGTSVVLTAVPSAGSLFGGWTGACTGTTPTCTVSVTAARTVTAAFRTGQAAAAPTNLTGFPNNGSVDVRWNVPSAGSAPITGYEMKLGTGSWTPLTLTATSPTQRWAQVTGLTNGVGVQFRVRAITAVGPGAASAPLTITAADFPGSPSGLTVTPGDRSLAVRFVAPTYNSGAAVTAYEYSLNGGVNWVTRTGSGSTAVSFTVSGLINGTTYNVSVRAVNSRGAGIGTPAVAGTPRTVPGAPTGVVATRGDRRLTITWVAPVATGGSVITGYEVSTNGGTSWVAVAGGAGARSHLASGLVNGRSYRVKVRAVNAAGAGAGSTTVTATPRA